MSRLPTSPGVSEVPTIDAGATEVEPYRRGVSLTDVAKGVLTRFLPGSLLTMVGAATLFGVGISSELISSIGGIVGLAGVLTAGFGFGLLGLRRWLYPDAKVDGSRSFVAGLAAPLAVFIAASVAEWGWTAAQFPLVVALVGLILAVGMFFAWLTPTPQEMRARDPDALPARDAGRRGFVASPKHEQ